MTNYDTSWVPEGHVLVVSKKGFYEGNYPYDKKVERYCAHLDSSGGILDPFGLKYEILGNYTTEVIGPGFWGGLMGQQGTSKKIFTRLVVGEQIPTNEHVVNAFERLRKSYEEVKALKDSEDEILGTYPPKTAKMIERK